MQASRSSAARPDASHGPEKKRPEGLRFVTLASTVARRLAVDTWLAQAGKPPPENYIQDAFETMSRDLIRPWSMREGWNPND
jgi:hypothetical protein